MCVLCFEKGGGGKFWLMWGLWDAGRDGKMERRVSGDSPSTDGDDEECAYSPVRCYERF